MIRMWTLYDEMVVARMTVYEVVGGQPFFDELVDRFYDGVESDDLLRPLYPDDLGPSRSRLAGFLAQYWGGPPHYSNERGHPRLRMRHAPFAIGARERNSWMKHMRSALHAVSMPDDIRSAMDAYFDNAATHLINTTHPPLDETDRRSARRIPLS